MEFLGRVFLSHGRITRGQWLLSVLALGTVCAAFGLLAHEVLGDGGEALMAIVFVWGVGALSIQRLHDIGRGGVNLAIVVLPVIGPVWLLLLIGRRGSEGPNRYGADPLSRFDYLRVDISR